MATPQKVGLVTRPALVTGDKVFALKKLRTSYQPSGGKPIALHKSTGFQGPCVHTMGSGIDELARTRGWTAAETFCWVYSQLWSGHPHAGIDTDGTVYVITDLSLVAVHCGAQPWMRKRYLDGSWREHVSPVGLKHWDKRWPGIKSPAGLLRKGTSFNFGWFGIELKPLPDGTFSPQQYRALAALIIEWCDLLGIDLAAFAAMVGHEDLVVFDTAERGRWNHKGGWDPGFLKDVPKFSWLILLTTMAAQRAAERIAS